MSLSKSNPKTVFESFSTFMEDLKQSTLRDPQLPNIKADGDKFVETIKSSSDKISKRLLK